MSSLFSLRGDRARNKDPGFRIQAKADASEATVYVYDEISYWGVRVADFVKEVAALDVATIHLRVNSPGGIVFDAMAMVAALRNHDAHVISHIDGLAASAASFLAMAADEVRMSDGAFLMIHNAWTFAYGDAAAFRKTADTLDKISESIINEYTKRSSASRDQIVQWMHDETWFTATEAKTHGFIDAVDGGVEEATNRFDLSIFQKVPDALKADAQGDTQERTTPPLRDVTVVRTTREQERVLRDAGLSVADAKLAVAALAKPVLNQREADESSESVHDAISRLLATIQTSHPAIPYGKGTN